MRNQSGGYHSYDEYVFMHGQQLPSFELRISAVADTFLSPAQPNLT